MAKRILVGSLLIAVLAGVLWLEYRLEAVGGRFAPIHGLPIAILIVLLTAAGFTEMANLASSAGLPILRRTGLACTAVLATLPFWRQLVPSALPGADLFILTFGLCLMALFLAQLANHRTEGVIRRLGTTLLAVTYLGVCGALALAIRTQFGVKCFVLFLLTVKLTDVGAYFTGSAIGRHKMIPWLSPGKSWEGLAGGVVLAAAVGVAFVAALNPIFGRGGQGGADMSLPAAAIFGAVMAVLGQGADLCESALKRDAGMKDSGSVIPGFGGVLDLLDSILLSAPAAYLFLSLYRG